MLIISAYEKLAFRKTTNLAVEPCINYSVITLGLLASTFNVLIGLPLVILLARLERAGYDEHFSVTSVRARTLPSQNACRVKADGMGPSYY